MQKKTIAVIEDDQPISNLLYESLTHEGYEVLRAYSGTEALYLLERHHPDLILLDLMLRPGQVIARSVLLEHISRDTPALCRVCDNLNLTYEIIAEHQADLYGEVNLTRLTLALAQENCEIQSLHQHDEGLENYFMNLVGGDCHV